MNVHGSFPRSPLPVWTLFAATVLAAAINAAAALANAPAEPLQEIAARVTGSGLGAMVPPGPLPGAAALALIALAWGFLRRRRVAWTAALLGLTGLLAVDALQREPMLELAMPAVAALVLLALRSWLVAEPYRQALAAHLVPSAVALNRTNELIQEHGRDTLDPFKSRPDVGHLFSAAGDAALAFRVENRCLLVAADPVGTDTGVIEVLRDARQLARGAGLRFGVAAASGPLATRLRDELGMHTLYMGCEAIVEPSAFNLGGKGIKKIRQAHRRALREGLRLELVDAEDLTRQDINRLEDCQRAARGDQPEHSFAMGPDSIHSLIRCGAVVVRACRPDGTLAGALVFCNLARRRMWSLGLQFRDPDSPNGVIDALMVHAIQAAATRGVRELSLNFAAARRYLHEPVSGLWPRVARQLARAATRYTQIDTLRAHNDKFSPRWDQRYLAADHVLQVPHLAFATIWQEGQLPRPDALIAPPWPVSGLDRHPHSQLATA